MQLDSVRPLLASRPLIAVLASSFTLLLLLLWANTKSISTAWNPSYATRKEAIYNSTLGFGKIFVINMPARTDHRDAMTLSASLTDIHVEFIDGIDGETVEPKALPPDYVHIAPSQVGSWRGHLNALQTIVSQNLSSALIFEDDIDWDIRLKRQLLDFSKGSNKLSNAPSSNFSTFDFHDVSPYGQDWDLLWLGHCGVQVPTSKPDEYVPAPYFLHHKDPTTVEYRYRPGIDFFLSKDHPKDRHLRVVHHAKEAVCTYAYAVSLKGARKILLALGLERLVQPYDGQLSAWCNKGFENRCLVSSPGYFGTHRPRGSNKWDSDINGEVWEQDVEVREKGITEGIRWSVRLNAERILRGWKDFDDSYPD